MLDVLIGGRLVRDPRSAGADGARRKILHHGLAVTASALLTAYDARQRRGDPRAFGNHRPRGAVGQPWTEMR